MKLKNKRGYNGNEIQDKEFNDGSGLELYDFNARTYDQQIGRFMQIDPKADEEDQEIVSPYHFGFNNPIKYNDPDGENPILGAILGAAVEVGSQMVANAVAGKNLTDISWKQVGVAAVEGALTSGASTLAKIVVKTGAAITSSAIDYKESGGNIKNLKDVGNIVKNAAITRVADKTTGAVAKVANGIGGKSLQEASNKIIGSKSQISKNIQANNAVSAKTANTIAKAVNSSQKQLAKAVREAPQKSAEAVTKGSANPTVTKLKDNTNL